MKKAISLGTREQQDRRLEIRIFLYKIIVYGLIWAAIAVCFLHIIGCGGSPAPSNSIAAPSTPIQANTQILSQALPNFESECIDQNTALFPSELSNCIPVFGDAHCQNDETENTLKLQAEWQSIQNWATAEFNQCLSRNVDPNLCFTDEEQELSRRSEWDCKMQVNWL